MTDNEMLLLILISFVSITLFSNVYTQVTHQDFCIIQDVSTYQSDYTNKDSLSESEQSVIEDFIDGLFEFTDKIPVINLITPFFKIATFGYCKNIPLFVSSFLWIIQLMFFWILAKLIRGN